jgi:hypothetical protein
VAPAEKRRATVDARTFLDPAKPAAGLQTAIDALPAAGGAVVLPSGEFVLHQSLFLREGVCIRGQGAATRLVLPSPIVWTTLVAPAAAGATTLQVADGAAFRPGWMLCLGVNPMYYLRSRAPWRVKRATANTIELDRPLAGPLKIGAPIGNWFPVIYAANTSRIEVRDLDIVGRHTDPAPFKGGYGASAVTFFFVREVRVCNVNVHGWKGDAFSFQGGRDNLLTGCSITGATEKGYHPGSCQQRMIISRCIADDCGDDGFFFCRYNQLSAMSNNTYRRNRGAMIGGLAKAGDMFNTINHNLGEDNEEGMSLGHGANDVMVGNIVRGTRTLPVIEFAGGDYLNARSRNHPYAGPARYHVVAGNVFAGELGEGEPIVAIRAGAGANVIANNQGLGADRIENESGDANVIAGNRQEREPAPARWTPPAPPPLPTPVVDAASHYDPDAPDCGFQKALDAAGKTGGTVRLPAGTYRLARSLVVPSGVTLCGEGIATRLVVIEDRTSAVTATDSENVGVRHMAIVGDGGPLKRGVSLNQVRGAVLESVNLTGLGIGVLAYDTSDTLISGCRARACGISYQLSVSRTTSLVESWALESENAGVLVAHGGERIRIDSCVIWHTRGWGVSVSDTKMGVTLMSNVISGSGNDGVLLHNAPGSLVRGNVIHNSSLRQLGHHAGVSLTGTTRDARVIENRIGDEIFSGHQRTAVREAAGAVGNIVRHNAVGPCQVPFDRISERLVTAGPEDAAAPYYILPAAQQTESRSAAE